MKSGDNMTKKSVGRPKSKNPKSESIHVRIDEKCIQILQDYCEREHITKAEGIRRGILLLKSKKN